MEMAGGTNHGSMSGFGIAKRMLVTVMIGILALIAILACEDYTPQAQIAEAVALATAVERQIAQTDHRSGQRNSLWAGS